MRSMMKPLSLWCLHCLAREWELSWNMAFVMHFANHCINNHFIIILPSKAVSVCFRVKHHAFSHVKICPVNFCSEKNGVSVYISLHTVYECYIVQFLYHLNNWHFSLTVLPCCQQQRLFLVPYQLLSTKGIFKVLVYIWNYICKTIFRQSLFWPTFHLVLLPTFTCKDIFLVCTILNVFFSSLNGHFPLSVTRTSMAFHRQWMKTYINTFAGLMLNITYIWIFMLVVYCNICIVYSIYFRIFYY